MVSVKAKVRGSRVWIEAAGHADYAEHGRDIVCAGVSVLTNYVANLAGRLAADGLIANYYCYPWEAPQSVYVDTGGNAAVMTAFQTAIESYEQMAEQYPEYISIQFL